MFLKKIQREKIFNTDIFILKYILDNSKSIPTKIFFRKILDFLVIFAILGAKKSIFWEKFWFFFAHFKKIELQLF